MHKRVVVTGMGIICAIGKNAEEAFISLKQSRSGVGPITILNTKNKDNVPAAEIKLSDAELADLAGVDINNHPTRTSLLGIIAAKEAFESAGYKCGKPDGILTGIVSSTTVGGMDKTEKHFYDFLSNNKYSHYILTHDCSDSTKKIADCLGIRNFLITVSTACSSSANAIMYGARLIKHGIVERVIVGGTDALSKFTLNGFNSLMILDKQPCRPFDDNRNGLNLGEGAGYLILESKEVALKNKKEILCELTGYANANDAYHQTASSPDGFGQYLAIKQALEKNGLSKEKIDYINAHGTGTDNNDLSEGIAIEKVFESNIPKVSSTKPFTGHTLAASGAVEAVFSIMSIKHQIIFPNLNFSKKMKELCFEPVEKIITDSEINHVISNSFGFGGNDTSLIFSKY